MTRSITAGVQTAFDSSNVPMIQLVELNFGTGYLRACNAPYAFTWNGNTYLGLGVLGAIEAIKESANLEANGVGLKLSGVPLDGDGDSEVIALALADVYQGRSCVIRAAPLDSEYRIIDTPVIVFSGRMDTMEIDLGATAVVTLTAESRLADMDRARVRHFNDADQQAEYPGDVGLQFAEQMVNKQIVWGRA